MGLHWGTPKAGTLTRTGLKVRGEGRSGVGRRAGRRVVLLRLGGRPGEVWPGTVAIRVSADTPPAAPQPNRAQSTPLTPLSQPNRTQSAPPPQIAQDVGDAAHGGQILMSHDAWTRLAHNMAAAGWPVVQLQGLFRVSVGVRRRVLRFESLTGGRGKLAGSQSLDGH